MKWFFLFKKKKKRIWSKEKICDSFLDNWHCTPCYIALCLKRIIEGFPLQMGEVKFINEKNYEREVKIQNLLWGRSKKKCELDPKIHKNVLEPFVLHSWEWGEIV